MGKKCKHSEDPEVGGISVDQLAARQLGLRTPVDSLALGIDPGHAGDHGFSGPQCAACHAKMDPLGFALENYDAIGRWREQDAGQPIDSTGELAGGESFEGPEELKDVLLSREDDLTRALTEKLVIYGLGRGLRPGDECTIADAVAAAKANHYRFSSIVLEIVNSFPFRYRMDPPF